MSSFQAIENSQYLYLREVLGVSSILKPQDLMLKKSYPSLLIVHQSEAEEELALLQKICSALQYSDFHVVHQNELTEEILRASGFCIQFGASEDLYQLCELEGRYQLNSEGLGLLLQRPDLKSRLWKEMKKLIQVMK